MSRKGNCLDNAVMENFFGHLKEEMYYRRDYRSVEELENAVSEYITYWNQKRIKLSLGDSARWNTGLSIKKPVN